MDALFWLSVALIAYVYAGYPVLLGVWARVAAGRRRGAAGGPGPLRDGPLPPVTVIIAARNEAARLPARIENLLASDYPADRLQIVVASDGSTDDTIAALEPYRSSVELILLPPGGKASALNAAVARARHPILVFADARQRFARDTIRRLVRHFDRLSVGAVSGELVLDCERGIGDSTVGDGVGAYWKYEKWLRRHEAMVGSTLGVTGAVYAMRRALWEPLPPGTILDDVLGPMRVVLRGYRVLFDAGALAFDEAARDVAVETQRKVRTLAGNFQLLALEPRLLLPVVNPVWLQFISHKIGRLAVPYALLAVLVSSAWLAAGSWFYAAVLGAQLVFYGLAVYGAVLDRRSRATSPLTEVVREAA
jgi:cellulose synthase/poly-beta-1,6-N-acetylglucosamine synthase-like glycosyltransferase